MSLRTPTWLSYDLVSEVERRGERADGGIAVGQRVAALTKTGGWADRVLLDASERARVQAGQTIVVLGAAGGVGSRSSSWPATQGST